MSMDLLDKPLALKKFHKGFPFCSAVIVAGGKGTRMEAKVNKVYLDLHGKMAILRTLEAFEQCYLVNEIILVVNERDLDFCKSEVAKRSELTKVKCIIPGGRRRQDSVSNGLKEIAEQSEIVLIHDGARPLVTVDIIEKSISAAFEYGAAITGMPVKDTTKTADENEFVNGTPDRKRLWSIQTPQTFKKELIIEAYKKADESDIEVTDDAMLVELMGYKVKLIEGSYENIKLTTPEDIAIAEAILKWREQEY